MFQSDLDVLAQSNRSYAVCTQGKTLRVANQDMDFDEVVCKKIIRGTVLRTNKRCGDNEGRILKIGYQLPKKQFLSLTEVCYDNSTGNIFYTQHLLEGSSIKCKSCFISKKNIKIPILDASKSNYRPNFSPDGLGEDIPASIIYKQVFQKATFSKLLKSSTLAGRYINENSFLSRSHLSPDADFLFAAFQYTTYYYINAIPQWQVINGGNWKKIEIMVRKLGVNLKKTLTIFTGTHDILALPDQVGHGTKIYLDSGSKLPVPKYVWKIIYDKEDRKAIVLVILNNPFVTQSDLLCANICSETGWSSSSWSDFERGFVHCCEYREFSAVVRTSPKLNVQNILTPGPK